MQELIAGVRSAVASTRYGDDLEALRNTGAEITRLEQTGGLPFLRIKVRRDEIARYGINASDVQLADIIVEEGPAQISRENIHRKINIEANVRARDLGGFVADVQRAIAGDAKLPTGYYVEYGGQFENLQLSSSRFLLVVPVASFLTFGLLYTTFNAAIPAMSIHINHPNRRHRRHCRALSSRHAIQYFRRRWGSFALFGVAVLNGVVMVSYFIELRKQGLSVAQAVRQGGELHLRPIFMTPLVAGLGFIPMAISTGAGAEVHSRSRLW